MEQRDISFPSKSSEKGSIRESLEYESPSSRLASLPWACNPESPIRLSVVLIAYPNAFPPTLTQQAMTTVGPFRPP